MKGKIFFKKQSYLFTEFPTISLPKALEWAKGSQNFVKNWINGESVFQMQTSGSTGTPKDIFIERDKMSASANATINFLELGEGTNALLCMNPEFIGGKMMLVRAMLGNWNLFVTPPNSTPIIHERIDFAAMVPLQVQSLMNTYEGITFLNGIEKLIIGGAPISKKLEIKLSELNTEVFQTFGMTETVSHIALKRINGPDKSDHYQVIGDNQVTENENGCLMIKGTVTSGNWLTTNDLVEITGDTFKWIGRADLVVNTGGIKVQIEPLEKELSKFFNCEIIIWKELDDLLGERIVGMTENSEAYTQIINNIDELKTSFKKYHFPKKWELIRRVELTGSGKIDRKKTFENILRSQ